MTASIAPPKRTRDRLRRNAAFMNPCVGLVHVKLFFCRFARERIRVARWFIFKPKIQNWVNFGGPWNGKKVGIFFGLLEYITAIWYILLPFGNLVALFVYFHPSVLVYCVEENLATLKRISKNVETVCPTGNRNFFFGAEGMSTREPILRPRFTTQLVA
jgi:hypothetical protein